MAQSENSEKVRPFPKAAVVAEAPATETVVPANDVAPQPKKPSRQPLVLVMAGVLAVAAAGWFGYEWFTTGQYMISTDDAYVEGDIATISAKLSGYIAAVNVVANQRVEAGDPLVTLDDGDYRIARDQAVANIDKQHLTLHRIDAQIVGGGASLAQAQANKLAQEATLQNAESTQARAAQLAKNAAGTQADLDSADAALAEAKANLTSGDAQIAAAQADINVLKGERAEAEADLKSLQLSLDKAERDLSFMVLRAPYSGVVGNLDAQVGDLVSTGTRLLALIPSQQLYIDANFKETQLKKLVPGQKVKIKVDALDDDAIEGTIESISPASGSIYSLLPPENATGNFTKVVQRVPVRIAIPASELAAGKLRAGLSVVVEVDTRTTPQS